MFHAGFLLGLFFDPEDEGIFLRNVGYFQRTTQRYIPGDRSLHNHRCENLESYTVDLFPRRGLRTATSPSCVHFVYLMQRIHEGKD
jgi:hypothetical protein